MRMGMPKTIRDRRQRGLDTVKIRLAQSFERSAKAG
jgi:hypothetical protein